MFHISHIIKAKATKLARPDYFGAESELEAKELEATLEEGGWSGIETRKILVRDSHIEGILKRCAEGSKAQRENLQILYNEQATA